MRAPAITPVLARGNIPWVRYAPVSGEILVTGSCQRRSTSALTAQDGAGLLFAEARSGLHWIDHAAVLDQAAASPPDWQSCVREKTASPASLTAAVEGELHHDLLAGPLEITNIPGWARLRISGPAGGSFELPIGTETVALSQPGDYRLTLASARHLPAEWTVHAY